MRNRWVLAIMMATPLFLFSQSSVPDRCLEDGEQFVVQMVDEGSGLVPIGGLFADGTTGTVSSTVTYGLRSGMYLIQNIPAEYPIQLRDHDAFIHIQTTTGTTVVDGGLEGTFYTGSILLVVTGNFDTASFFAFGEGYVGMEGALIHSFTCPFSDLASFPMCNDPDYAEYHPYAVASDDCATGCTDPTACAFGNPPFSTSPYGEETTDVCAVIDTVMVHTTGSLAGMTTYRVYIELARADDYLTAIYGDYRDPLLLETTTSFYQDDAGGLLGQDNYAPVLVLDPSDPVHYDTWLTIGYDPDSGVAPNNTDTYIFTNDNNPWSAELEDTGANVSMAGDLIGGAWYIFPGDTMGYPMTEGEHEGRVLVAQFTTAGELSGTVSGQYFRDYDTVDEMEYRFTVNLGACQEVYTVTCEYLTAPTLDVTLSLDADGLATLDAASVYDAANGTCAPASYAVDPSNFTCADLGANTVTLTVTDNGGNEATGTATVTVVDELAPTFSDVPENITSGSDPGLCGGAVSWTAPTASDNCGVASLTSTHPPGSTFDVGTTTVVYTAVDASGNSATASFTVTVTDAEGPAFTNVPENINVNTDGGLCSAAVTWTAPTATDNCGVDDVVPSHTPGASFPTGTTTVSYTASDAAGNETTASFTVTVTDGEAPALADLPQDISVPAASGLCAAAVTWTAPTATDNCGVTGLTGSHTPGDTFNVGVTTVTYTATDAAGNQASDSFTVTVMDGQAPAFANVPENIAVGSDPGECAAAVSWDAPTAADNCAVTNVTASHAPGDSFDVGETTVTYTATDAAGNEATASFTVTVSDTEPPVLTASGVNVITVPFESTAVVAASSLANAADNCGAGDIEVSLDSTEWALSFETGCADSVTVYLRVADAAGNMGTLTRTLLVVGEDNDSDGVPWCEEVLGCTDYLYCNYDPAATEDDGSCSHIGCVCPDLTGDGQITVQDLLVLLSDFGCTENCIAELDGVPPVGAGDLLILLATVGNTCADGCMNPEAANYNPDANHHDGSCVFTETTITIMVFDGQAESLDAFAQYAAAEHGRLDVAILSPPATGTAEAFPDGTVTFTPGQDFATSDTFTYTLSDGGASVTVTVNVIEGIYGCTDPGFTEYDPAANADDGSCATAVVNGCTDPAFTEYNPAANTDDGSCATAVVSGCTDPAFTEYDPTANTDDGSCVTAVVNGCTDPAFTEYDPAANTDDGSCATVVVNGCTDPAYLEYNADANTDDGSCSTLIVAGCTDPAYLEYDPNANSDDGSCATLASNCVAPTLDGYTYEVVEIGGQCWFGENLRTSVYADGSEITTGLGAFDWKTTTEGAVTVFGAAQDETCGHSSPDIDACDSVQSLAAYGRLYNRYAVLDARNICPTGWHVATNDDWLDMAAAVGGFVGTKLKSTTGWANSGNGTDEYGFTAVPGGIRSYSEFSGYLNAGSVGYHWTGSGSMWSFLDDEVGYDVTNAPNARNGASVRCIQDAE